VTVHTTQVNYCEVGGLTHGALYSHFGSKDDLAAAAFTQGQSASRKRMTAAIGEAPDLAAIVDCYDPLTTGTISRPAVRCSLRLVTRQGRAVLSELALQTHFVTSVI
jgi:TetR/AcrR family transcriptional repressor of nem operon